MSLTSFDSAYAISSAVSKLGTVGDLCDLQGSKGHFCLWQPSYNSVSTGPIETSLTSFDSAYAISSAVSKLVTVGDLCDLQGSKGHFCLWQPSFAYGTRPNPSRLPPAVFFFRSPKKNFFPYATNPLNFPKPVLKYMTSFLITVT